MATHDGAAGSDTAKSDHRRTLVLDEPRRVALSRWLAAALAADTCEITGQQLLSGGAVQENWRLELALTSAGDARKRTVLLRTDSVHRLPLSIDRTAEFAVVRAAHRAGVIVAEPIARSADTTVIGAPFMIQAFADGTANARKLVRDPTLGDFGPALARSLGRELAKIHAITPDTAGGSAASGSGDLACLPVPLQSPARAMVGQIRALIDSVGEPRPALEYALVWLDAHAPENRRLVLSHGDFRTGNYMVRDGRLTAILDWEFAHWGDPAGDIGWFTAPCWRFGSTLEAGGIAAIEPFLAGYTDGGGERPTPRDIAYWRIMAAARWASIALLQAGRFHAGDRTLEAALTGLMPPEMELDALDGIAAFERIADKGVR